MCMSICTSIHMSIHISIYMSIHMSIHMSMHLHLERSSDVADYSDNDMHAMLVPHIACAPMREEMLQQTLQGWGENLEERE